MENKENKETMKVTYMQDPQWYPGHMAKTKKLLAENIKLVDVIIEVLDARIPYSSKNPDLESLSKNKFRIIVLNKSDLADTAVLKEWMAYYESMGAKSVPAESIRGRGIGDVIGVARELMKEKIEAQKKRGRVFMPIRAMVVGIPNSGKSTFINKFVGKDIAKAADRPGVTRGKQWVRIVKDFELLDMPGILWPKFDDRQVGLKLAFTGAVNDATNDIVLLAYELIACIVSLYPQALPQRYNIDILPEDDETLILAKIAKARGFILKKGELDLSRAATILIDEFRSGRLGKMTLDRIAGTVSGSVKTEVE